MFAEQRMEIIKRMLREQKHVNIGTLSAALKVSDVTVRKYLDILERQGMLIKVHGGAIRADERQGAPLAAPEGDASLEAIAELAVTLIESGDSVYLGPGLTCSAFARRLSGLERPHISVMTNNFVAMPFLGGKIENLSFIGGDVAVLGGGSAYTYGAKTAIFLEEMAVGKAFISCDGIDADAGITAHSPQFVEMVRQIARITREMHILAASPKFGKVAMHRLCPLEAPLTIVTDACVGDSYKHTCYERGVRLLTAYKAT